MTVYERLAACGDEKYRDFQSKLVPNIPKETILGVKTPDIRRIAKAIQKAVESFRVSDEHKEYLKTLRQTEGE